MDEKQGVGEGDARHGIAARVAEYLHSMTHLRDPELVADFYTADARLLGPGTDLDRTGVVEAIRGVFEAGVQVRVERRTLEVFSHGEVAYEIASAEDTFVQPDGASQTVSNHLFIRWERGSDGAWRFARVLLSPRQPESGDRR
jgi:uncharacterized protein (TIGR02246 family)